MKDKERDAAFNAAVKATNTAYKQLKTERRKARAAEDRKDSEEFKRAILAVKQAYLAAPGYINLPKIEAEQANRLLRENADLSAGTETLKAVVSESIDAVKAEEAALTSQAIDHIKASQPSVETVNPPKQPPIPTPAPDAPAATADEDDLEPGELIEDSEPLLPGEGLKV